jgi:glucuronokinase
MLLCRKHAFARAALVGNPSDGYHGKTLSVAIRDLQAQVVLAESDVINLVGNPEDENCFASVHDLVRDVRLHGYYGGVRLVKATLKKFVEYCATRGLSLHARNFTIRYSSIIPRQVGLAGSSAIIVATLRCLMDFYQVAIPREVQPSLALAVERDELGIAAGLQDRAVQVYEGLLFMDFGKDVVRQLHGFECGAYEPLDPALLPPLYLAYKPTAGEPTEVFHNDLRARFERGEAAVFDAMSVLAAIAAQARTALVARDADRLGRLMDENFDIRRLISSLPAAQVEMVDVARRAGASANFAGSGGAIIGTYSGEGAFRDLRTAMEAIGCVVLQPCVAAN